MTAVHCCGAPCCYQQQLCADSTGLDRIWWAGWCKLSAASLKASSLPAGRPQAGVEQKLPCVSLM